MHFTWTPYLMSKRREEAIIAMETNLEVLRLEVAEAANQVQFLAFV